MLLIFFYFNNQTFNEILYFSTIKHCFEFLLRPCILCKRIETNEWILDTQYSTYRFLFEDLSAQSIYVRFGSFLLYSFQSVKDWYCRKLIKRAL